MLPKTRSWSVIISSIQLDGIHSSWLESLFSLLKSNADEEQIDSQFFIVASFVDDYKRKHLFPSHDVDLSNLTNNSIKWPTNSRIDSNDGQADKFSLSFQILTDERMNENEWNVSCIRRIVPKFIVLNLSICNGKTMIPFAHVKFGISGRELCNAQVVLNLQEFINKDDSIKSNDIASTFPQKCSFSKYNESKLQFHEIEVAVDDHQRVIDFPTEIFDEAKFRFRVSVLATNTRDHITPPSLHQDIPLQNKRKVSNENTVINKNESKPSQLVSETLDARNSDLDNRQKKVFEQKISCNPFAVLYELFDCGSPKKGSVHSKDVYKSLFTSKTPNYKLRCLKEDDQDVDSFCLRKKVKFSVKAELRIFHDEGTVLSKEFSDETNGQNDAHNATTVESFNHSSPKSVFVLDPQIRVDHAMELPKLLDLSLNEEVDEDEEDLAMNLLKVKDARDLIRQFAQEQGVDPIFVI